MTDRYDIHGLLTVETDLDIQIPDYFAVDAVSRPDVWIRENEVDLPPRDGKRCGVFRYWADYGRLTVDYKTPVRTARFVIKDMETLFYTPAMAAHGDVHTVARTLYELAWIRAGYSLVHAAALDLDGRGVLVTAPPDSGKTSTVLSQLNGDGTRLLADDHTLLTADGTALSYPRPVNISPFTLTGGAVEPSDGPIQRVKRGMARSRGEMLFASLGIEMGERKQVPTDLLTDSVDIDTVVVLSAGNDGVEAITSDTAANQVMLSTMDGMDPFGHYSIPLYAHEFDIDIYGYLDDLRAGICDAIQGADCYRLSANRVPEYPGLVEEVLA